jgi:hypothetical protein
MNLATSIVRIALGIIVLILTYSTHARVAEDIKAGKQAMIYGIQTSATVGQLNLGFLAVGIVGLAFLVLGVMGLLKARQ